MGVNRKRDSKIRAMSRSVSSSSDEFLVFTGLSNERKVVIVLYDNATTTFIVSLMTFGTILLLAPR